MNLWLSCLPLCSWNRGSPGNWHSGQCWCVLVLWQWCRQPWEGHPCRSEPPSPCLPTPPPPVTLPAFPLFYVSVPLLLRSESHPWQCLSQGAPGWNERAVGFLHHWTSGSALPTTRTKTTLAPCALSSVLMPSPSGTPVITFPSCLFLPTPRLPGCTLVSFS